MNTHTRIKTIAGVSLSIALTGVLFISNMEVTSDKNNAQNPSNTQLEKTSTHLSSLNSNDVNTNTTSEQTNHDTRYEGPSDKGISAKYLSAKEYENISTFGPLPSSLKGSAIPPLYLTSDGNLISDKRAKHFIEYFLSAAREEGALQIHGRMQEYFSAVLEEPALSQAYELLDNYMNYRYQLDSVASRNDINQPGVDKITAVKETLERRKALRRETLGDDVASAMFGESEQYEQYAINMMQTNQNQILSEAEKQTLFAQHEENLPTHIKERIRYNREARNIEQQINTLKAEGKNNEQIYQLRKDFYGEKSADMWAFIEDNSADWNSRVDVFNQQKTQILASLMMTDEQKREQINAIRERDFDEQERLKLAWQSLQ